MSAASSSISEVRVQDIEVVAASLDAAQASAIYKQHGCLVVRGLMKEYIADVHRDIEASARQAISLLGSAQRITEGWTTPDGSLFLPAPAHFSRDKQLMVLAVSYQTSAAFFRSAMDSRTLDLMEAILGPDVELYLNGQCLYKEPVGGHPKHLHQDAAYFEHRFEGPVGILTYVVDTDLVNGALYVAPGSHRLGMLKHVDTFSHLGLDSDEWPWERALPITGQAGDAILFHVKTVHGSQENNSNSPRPVMIHRYRAANDYVTVTGTTVENRAANEMRTEQARKENQHGLMLRGFRRYEENRA